MYNIPKPKDPYSILGVAQRGLYHQQGDIGQPLYLRDKPRAQVTLHILD